MEGVENTKKDIYEQQAIRPNGSPKSRILFPVLLLFRVHFEKTVKQKFQRFHDRVEKSATLHNP